MKIKQKISSALTRYKRVWRLLKKPTKQEFLTVSKITSIGLAVIGVVGFVVAFIMNFINW
jgi:protein transport protein SEC61 subunit gamma-like protein